MVDKDQAPGLEGVSTGLDLASLDTVFGKIFIDPFSVAGVYDHPKVTGHVTLEGVSGQAKSTLVLRDASPADFLPLTITAEEAYAILNKAAKAIQAERGKE